MNPDVCNDPRAGAFRSDRRDALKKDTNAHLFSGAFGNVKKVKKKNEA